MMERYHQPSDLPERLPLFPLRGAILLPRATLPLHIFEPRYLQMIDDVMSGGRVIGIVQPKLPRGDEDIEESPSSKTHPLQKIGCAGRVTTYQELDDARVMITLSGITRFEIAAEIDEDCPYRLAQANFDAFAQDFTIGFGESQVDRQKLLAALKAYLEAKKLSADWDNIRRASSEQLINALSVMSPFGAEEKQALLEAKTLKERATVLITLAEMELASGGGSASTLQ